MSRKRGLSRQRRARQIRRLQPRSYTVVVCYDGEKTEAEYFIGWRRALNGVGIDVRPILVGSGGNSLAAVEAAISQMKADSEYDEYWCVCDVDDTSKADLDLAQQRASEAGLGLALSCRSFEVWIALHWEKISTAELSCERDCVALVSKHHSKYTARAKVIPFDVLLPKTGDAITNASWLRARALNNPFTDVHLLVKTLHDRLIRG